MLQREIGQHNDRVCLKVGRSFLASTGKASAACSRQEYRVSTYARNFLMKNIGLCFRFSSSLNKVALTKTSNTAR